MARYCEYCGSILGLNDRVCPGCGAPVPTDSAAVPAAELHRSGMPRTIEELKAFCREKNMPLAQMRFFIGQDTPDARAFGIFRDYDGNYIVYKNKSDGSRSVRYQGPDEAYAVREIYLKLRDETEKRRGITRDPQPVRSGGGKKSLAGIFSPIIVVIIAAVLAVSMLLSSGPKKPYNGYYLYNNNYYYHQDDDWYYYSYTVLDWLSMGAVDEELEDHFEDYYSSSYYHDDYGIESFDEASFDSESEADEDDSDSWDYDFDSWDAGDTDWDSDW